MKTIFEIVESSSTVAGKAVNKIIDHF